MNVSLSEFDYPLPEALIALEPVRDRVSARLMKIDRSSGEWTHAVFSEIVDCFHEGDVLVLNDTRVIPARLLGHRASGGQAETLLLEARENGEWEALVRPSGRVRKGDTLSFGENGERLEAEVLDDPREGNGMRRVRFADPQFSEKLQRIGHIPLPPYIQRQDNEADREDYQTVFAREEGAIAAPTAGLHFNEALLDTLRARGVQIVPVTLHVSYGSFQPVELEDITRHEMFFERYELSDAAAQEINAAKRDGRRVIACGTTSVRVLEHSATEDGQVVPGTGSTNLFIYPSYRYRIVDGLITNFHLPKSTLLLLVSAFLGTEKLMAAYREAMEQKYRFYSYGDAMVIL